MLNMGKPCGGGFVAAAFLRHDGMRGEMRQQALHHQLFGGAVGFRHQVELALELEAHAALEVTRQQRAGLAGDLHGRFQITGHRYLSS
jgi:hypothetical protein